MLKHRLLHKGKSKLYIILTVLACTNVFMGLLVYALFAWIMSQTSPAVPMYFKVLAAVISVLIAVIVYQSFVFLGRARKEKVQMEELKNFKTFIRTLYHASTDIEAYDILRDFIAMTNIADEVSLVYKASDHDNNSSWQDISAENAAVCDTFYNCCPLLDGGKDFIYGDLSSETKCPLEINKSGRGSYLCLLVTNEEHFCSILQLYSKREKAFNQTTISIIKSYVEIARPVIKSKHALSILSKKATTDYLTKLYNRDFLETYLQNQIEVSNLSKQPLSIIMIDVDCFKNINDTYGHASGDYLLIYFAEIAMKCVRKTDAVVRYGGDEFIVILPSTDTQTAVIISERIRCNLEKSMIQSIDGNNILFATCSLGVSTYPILCSSKDDLLKTADMALYKAKRSRKNCTMVYEKDLATR